MEDSLKDKEAILFNPIMSLNDPLVERLSKRLSKRLANEYHFPQTPKQGSLFPLNLMLFSLSSIEYNIARLAKQSRIATLLVFSRLSPRGLARSRGRRTIATFVPK
jgi:hypothetical protein